MKMRESEAVDSSKVAEVICRSIKALCFEDHKNNSEILNRWLDNKNAETIEGWIAASSCYCVTALNDYGEVVGFAMLSREGELKLLYVSPDETGTGLGQAMLANIEHCAKSWGLSHISLDSTDSALNFYKHHGYKYSSSCKTRTDGLNCNGMVKCVAM